MAWMTTDQVAGRLNCSTSHVQNLAKTGKLPSERLGGGPKGKWIFRSEDVDAYIERHPPGQPQAGGFQKGNTVWAGSGSTGAIADLLRQQLTEQRKTNDLLQQQLEAWRP